MGEDIVTVAESIFLETDGGDVDELVEEMCVEDFQELLAEEHRMAAEELCKGEESRQSV